jgi:hypothetical protein
MEQAEAAQLAAFLFSKFWRQQTSQPKDSCLAALQESAFDAVDGSS